MNDFSDLSIIEGMPFSQMNLTDLSPIAKSRGLTSLTLPPNAKDIEFLPGQPVAEPKDLT